MTETTRRAARLLERAQSGHARAALDEAESVLRQYTGNIADGPAGMHFVRAIALANLGDPHAPLPALDLMARAAEREGSPGWHACALATRASHVLRLGETGYDADGVLHDLVTAEILVVEETEPIAAVNARVAVAIGYFELRLYELVGAQYDAAYEMSPPGSGNRAMWLSNQAELHLFWALELYQIGEVAAAESHTAEAERYALRAAAEADGPDAPAWRDHAMLAAACAKADRHNPAGAAVEIAEALAVLEARGVSPTALAYSRPFHAVALRRSGRHDEALEVIERAVAALPPDSGWLIEASTHRTRAVLLAASGSADATVGLSYGDTLAGALWRQRLRTLQTVGTMKSLELLRIQHEQAARAAALDALTGVANRGAFDLAVRQAQTHPADLVTVLLIDTDKFKQINDTAGHAAGDAALRAIAAALSAQIRDGDLLARLGGDEFAALLPGVGAAEARRIAERMVAAVRRIPDCPATVSVGIAAAYAADLPEALRRADEAMYQVKRRGGDGVEEYAEQSARAA
ncbi:GGDEF domain-containing protein [Paractinoplanes globisporus]|uniref:Diguanylate cyclase domain-containing protein n=1 Tax=Paractinoplanes globisporus TaxID=113565 RepID=A0ABW6W4D4_9ACTN|nr:GGDEF domain-containing protein [Actinoplanes globisporus]